MSISENNLIDIQILHLITSIIIGNMVESNMRTYCLQPVPTPLPQIILSFEHAISHHDNRYNLPT